MSKLIKPICKECAESFGLKVCEAGCFYNTTCINCGEEKELHNISLESDKHLLSYYLSI